MPERELILSEDFVLTFSKDSILASKLKPAFTPKVREEILKRDGGKSVLSGETENLQAAHINHDKSSPRYNDPSNGRTLTVEEHLKDHILREGRNGLTKPQNDFAIRKLTETLVYVKPPEDPPPPDE